MEIVKPNKKISREATENDIKRIVQNFLEMVEFCLSPPKDFRAVLALAHCQITEDDPLRFFVTNEKEVIVNPEMVNHTRHTVDSLEGCVSYPKNDNITVQRYNKCEMKYYIIDEHSELVEKTESANGQRAKMFQHELDHFNGIYIYDKE